MKPEPHAEDHRRSARAKGDRRNGPTSLAGLLRWCQEGYRLEAPNRLHDRDTADDGTPDHTGEAKGYFGFAQQREPNDWRAVACSIDVDGFYRTPMRCAIARIGDPDRRALLGGLAVNLLTPLDVTRTFDIPDKWASIIMRDVLSELWRAYSDRPIPQRTRKSDAQLDAEAAA